MYWGGVNLYLTSDWKKLFHSINVCVSIMYTCTCLCIFIFHPVKCFSESLVNQEHIYIL